MSDGLPKPTMRQAAALEALSDEWLAAFLDEHLSSYEAKLGGGGDMHLSAVAILEDEIPLRFVLREIATRLKRRDEATRYDPPNDDA